MVNFLTFSEVTFKPGPRMNLVIGPNGSGKSTIVSAICIVFGGKPGLLGRHPDLGAFVKHFAEEACVEAWIYEPSRPTGYVSVKREFDRDGKGRFFLNNKQCKQFDILHKVVRKYDIQLDNMSQFMPQEKIADFIQHKPIELLGVAVRSLGGAEKESVFCELKDQDEKMQGHTEVLKQYEDQLSHLLECQENDEEQVKAYREQQKLRDKLRLLRAFRPRLVEVEKRSALMSLREESKALDARLKVLLDHVQRANSGPINACKQEVEAAKVAFTTAKSNTQHVESSCNSTIDGLQNVSAKIVQTSAELRDVEARAARTQDSIRQAENKLQLAEGELQQFETEHRAEETGAELREQESKRTQLRSSRREEEDKRREMQQEQDSADKRIEFYNRRLSELADVRKQRMDALARLPNGRFIVECDRFVADLIHRHTFRGKVYGPVAAFIEVREPYHARIMEHCVPTWIVSAYVAESGQDARTLMRLCKDQFKKSPDVITAPTNAHDELDMDKISRQQPYRPVDQRLLQLGLENVVDRVYSAPPPVKAALNAQLGLHNIYVGNETASQFQDDLRMENDIYSWYTPEARVNLSRSRFDPNARNLRVETSFQTKTGQLYRGNVQDIESQRNELVQKLRDYERSRQVAVDGIKHAEDTIASMHSQQRNLDTRIAELVHMRSERAKLEDRVARLEVHVKDVKTRAARLDVDREKQTLSEKLRGFDRQSTVMISDVWSKLEELRDSMAGIDAKMVERCCALTELQIEENKHSESKSELDQMKAQKNEMKVERERVKADWKGAQDAANRALSEEERLQYADMLDPYLERSVNELDDKIVDMEGQMDGLANGGENVVEAFEHRQAKIEKLRADIANLEVSHGRREENLRIRKREFLRWLEGSMEAMRNKFSTLYSRLGCSGDLRLQNLESGRLKELELQVWVSYRNEAELRQVNANSNSGGEKMCCTMIFCFSLQLEEERIPPFVVVDELNQGLDPVNEMKIMTMMIDDSEKDNAAQTFVITPKLLSNLPLRSNTKTHIIFNGPVDAKPPT